MQLKDVRPEPFTKEIRCDRCGSNALLNDNEFHEFASLDLRAGYGSIFGDGNLVQIDLCQHCLKATLGQWIRVVEPLAESEISRRLQLFDPARHGGEFPTASDRGEPDDPPVPVQRTAIGTEYISLADMPADLRDPLWAYLGAVRGRLLVPGVGEACLLSDWKAWRSEHAK